MDKLKLIVGIILFGSIWGLAESIIGPMLNTANLPSGALLTSIFAIGLMVFSRILFQQRGMQFGMGIVAGTLRMFNPFSSCVICSAIAIAAEGLIFEIIWYKIPLDFKNLNNLKITSSLGIISAYFCYIGGYFITQILTPIVASADFYIVNLISFIPQILSRGLIAAIIGGITLPIVLSLKDINISNIKDKIYYPTAAAISVLCWIIVITNSIFFV
jgi:hypothetical protein